MTPECIILIARLCLPAETQSIEVTSHLFGQRADVVLGSARIGLIISSDEVGSGTMGLTQLCAENACVQARAIDVTRPGSVLRRYTLRFAGEPGPRSLVIEAPDAAQLEGAAKKLRVLVSEAGDAARYIDLDRVEPATFD